MEVNKQRAGTGAGADAITRGARKQVPTASATANTVESIVEVNVHDDEMGLSYYSYGLPTFFFIVIALYLLFTGAHTSGAPGQNRLE